MLNENWPSSESAVSFAPLGPAGFVNFTGRGGAGQSLLFVVRGKVGLGEKPVFYGCLPLVLGPSRLE